MNVNYDGLLQDCSKSTTLAMQWGYCSIVQSNFQYQLSNVLHFTSFANHLMVTLYTLVPFSCLAQFKEYKWIFDGIGGVKTG